LAQQDARTPEPDGTSGPWRILVLDTSDRSDPKWIMATVAVPADVRPAVIEETGRYCDWQEVREWVREQVGRPVSLRPIGAIAWLIDERTS
jgi:hypothetical protein